MAEADENTSTNAAPAPLPESAPAPHHGLGQEVPPLLPPGFPQGNIPAGMLGIATTQVQLWQGQFPPPEAIASYERTLPGAFDRIIKMAERQQDSMIVATADARRRRWWDTFWGQLLGTLVALSAIAGAVILALYDHPTVAVALVAVPITAVAMALINGSRKGKSANTPAVQATEQQKSEDT